MSAQTFSDVFAPVEARYRAQVIEATWGHLAPRKNKMYPGFVVFALGCFDCGDLNPTPLSCEFKGLDDSPWFYNALIEFLQSLRGEEGAVYRWDGTFRNYEFHGTVQRCNLVVNTPVSRPLRATPAAPDVSTPAQRPPE